MPEDILEGNKWSTKGNAVKKEKHPPALANTQPPYHIKKFVLSTLYKLAQDHKLLIKVDFVL